MTRTMMELSSRRYQETESFLKRVEEYDSQRRSPTKAKPPLKEKPERLKSSFPEESLERARRLLDGESPREINSRTLSPETASSTLAYKSAYNYEKSFSPPRNSHTLKSLGLEVDSSPLQRGDSGKTFVISEEDFLLLQQLKSAKMSSTTLTDAEPVKKFYPSRGRPREMHRESPSLPDRPDRREEPQSSEGEAPSLPARKYRQKSEVDTPIKVEKLARESPVLPPKRKGFKVEENHNSAPVVPPKKREAADSQPSADIGNQKAAENSTSMTFVDSLEKNKLTKVPQVGTPRTPKKTTSASHLDFLDSVQLNPKQEGRPQANPVAISPSTSENGSFIKSALKTTGTTPTNNSRRTGKPALPRKPAKLQNPGDSQDKSKLVVGEEKTVNEIMTPKLRAVERTKPKVPAKKDNLVIPKLRPVAAPANRSINGSDKDTLSNQSVPSIALKKVEVRSTKGRDLEPPEALIKMGQLNKNPSTNPPASQKDVPEALTKLGGLRKSKAAPPVPKRNISLPEALQKAENLRAAQTQPTKPSQEHDFRSELDVVLKTPRSEVSIQSQNEKLPPRGSATSSTTSLNHPNKNRSRGPKRKLPSKIH